MIIRAAELDRIRAGEIDLAFRRWERPRVTIGTRLRTAIGLVEVTSLEPTSVERLQTSDAKRAGASSLAHLREGLAVHPERTVYRVGLTFVGPDPREALRETVPDAAEMAGIAAGLCRLDAASSIGPWTLKTLRLIDAQPEVRAPDLAAQVGRPTADFKRDVRKLKERGLTESLAIGYRISPRGAAVLDHLDGPRERAPRREGTPLPRSIGAPATGALRQVEVHTLEDVTAWTRDDLAALHGVGPVALDRLEAALGERGWGYRTV